MLQPLPGGQARRPVTCYHHQVCAALSPALIATLALLIRLL